MKDERTSDIESVVGAEPSRAAGQNTFDELMTVVIQMIVRKPDSQ
jgi:hypothetical protein